MLPRNRHTTWIASFALVAGVHLGVLGHELLRPPEVAPPSVVVTSITHHAHAAAPTRPLAHCPGEHLCVIDRAALRDAFDRNDARLLRSVRAEPVDGGLELSGIAEDGLLGRVGLRNGDVLTGIDGHPLRNGSDVEILLAHLERGHFYLAVLRDGRELVKRFELRDAAPGCTGA